MSARAAKPKPKPKPRAKAAPQRATRRARKLRIGITCYPTFGGSGIVATELGRRLARAGDEIHFISSSLPYRLPAFERNVFFHEVVLESYPLFQHAPPLALALATKMAEVAETHALDVLHVHYAMPFATSAFLAKHLVAPARLPVVTTLHGTDITIVGQQPALLRMTKFTIESSDRVTAVSEALRDATVDTLGVRKRIAVIPNFVDPDVFAPRSARRSRLLAPAGARVLMHASNFRPVKNVDQVVRIFAAVHERMDARLVMVGDGPEKPRAEELARQLGVAKHVLFLGNQEVMEELLPLADLFLLPSSTESFGLVALEAMAAGVPVVAARVGGLPELIESGVTGFLEPAGDLDAHVRAALRVLESDALHRRVARAARRRAVDTFHVDRIVERYRAVLVEGALGVLDAKTAVALLRYAPESVAALIDTQAAGKTAQDALGVGGAAPVVATLEAAMAHRPDALLVGIAPVGGRLPEAWRAVLLEALDRGLDVWAGLHSFLADDPELAARAAARGRRLVDLRAVPGELPVASGRVREVAAHVVLTVGSDCNVGKMTASWELHRGLLARGVRSAFVATGQTGVLLAGRGLAVDRVIADFVAGAAETLVLDAAKDHDVVIVEGQGSIVHPGYAGVTLGLLHGTLPHTMILCHQATRTRIRHGEIPIPPLTDLVRRYEDALAPIRPGRVVALALNTFDLSDDEAAFALDGAARASGLPACDPVRQGPGALVDAVLAAREGALR